ncbi:MAG: hypothetical protein IJ048_10435 [Clostridia bacterium]|nr:hypothetical protein [Clostridia bacterium]
MNRRLPNPYLDEHRPSPYGKLIVRILLIAAAVAVLLAGALFFLPGETLFVWYWAYIVALGLPIVFVLAAVAVKMHASIKSKWPRIVCTAIFGMIALTAAVIIYSLCMVYAQVGINPAAYYTSPDTGNRLVIMKAVDFDNSDEETQKMVYFYGAYPMRNKYFYYPNRGDMISTNSGIDYVEWTEGGMAAAVHITDLEGVEQVIDIDFNAPAQENMPSSSEQP